MYIFKKKGKNVKTYLCLFLHGLDFLFGHHFGKQKDLNNQYSFLSFFQNKVWLKLVH